MKLLLDTHIILWTLAGDERLSQKARELIEHPESEIYYSTASPWETDIKHALHPEAMSLSGAQMIEYCDEAGFLPLPIANRHIRNLCTLERADGAPPHRDPFDRIMIAQAKTDGMLFVTHDALLPWYGESCIVFV